MAGRSELLRVFVRQCRRRLFGLKVADSTGARLSGGMLPARTMVLRRLLTRAYLDPDERNAGLPLPPSAGGFVTNVALALAGRVAIILNYSLSVLSDLGAHKPRIALWGTKSTSVLISDNGDGAPSVSIC